MNYFAGWYAIFVREMLLFRRKFFKFSYLFSSMVTPLIYLVTFGFGLGRSVSVSGTDYLSFLIPGLVAMSSMNNSYNWVASALNLNRLYHKTFQVFIQAPITSAGIMVGEVLAGMVKGLFASVLVIIVGLVGAPKFHLSALFVLTLLLNCFMFACLGVAVGMLAKTHEDTSTYSNFFITPMAFFSGTFFPLDKMPDLLRYLIYCMPLTHTNILIRKTSLDTQALVSLGVIVVLALVFFIWGSRLIRAYNE